LRGSGNTRGVYLAAIIASILVIGGFSPAIGILGGGELRGEGVQKGDTGNELLGGRGNNGGFREEANGLVSADSSLYIEAATVTRGVVNLGLGKSCVVLGPRQGIASGKRGVRRLSPSNPRLGGENLVGTLIKFRKQEASEKGLLGS
jgi:hypothetical protein